jgi:hypothetical protein
MHLADSAKASKNDRCCTLLLYKIKEAISILLRWPLSCVGTTGFEPATP